MRGQQGIGSRGQPGYAGKIDGIPRRTAEAGVLLPVPRREGAGVAGEDGVGVGIAQDIVRSARTHAELVGLQIAATGEIEGRARLHVDAGRLGADGFPGQRQQRDDECIGIVSPAAAVHRGPERDQAAGSSGDGSQAAILEHQGIGGAESQLSERRPYVPALHDVGGIHGEAAEGGQRLRGRQGMAAERDRLPRRLDGELAVGGGGDHRAAEKQIARARKRARRSRRIAAAHPRQPHFLGPAQFSARHAAQGQVARQFQQPRVCLERAAARNRSIGHAHTFDVVIAQPHGFRLQGGIAPGATTHFDAWCIQRHFLQGQRAAGPQVQAIFQPDGIPALERDAVETRRFQRRGAQPGLAVQPGGYGAAGNQAAGLRRHAGRETHYPFPGGVP